jgi:hypothetical protein
MTVAKNVVTRYTDVPHASTFLPSADSKAVCGRPRKHFLTPLPPDIIESQL